MSKLTDFFRTKIQQPPTYKRLYKTFAFIRYEVLKPSSFVSPGATLVVVLVLFKLTGSITYTSLGTVIFYALLWLISQLLWLVIQRAIRNSGSKDKFIFPGKYIIQNEADPVELKLDDINQDRFEFATEKTAGIAADLNVKAYRNSRWTASFAEKFERNLSHIRKNKYSILLVKSLTDDKFLGYTHVLPVTTGTWEKYNNAQIGDNKFMDNLIVADKGPYRRFKKPFGLILFSVGSVFIDDELKSKPDLKAAIGELYEQAIVYHISKYLQTMFKDQEKVMVLLQNMGKDYLKFFSPFAKSTTRLSYDGARIIVFEVANFEETSEE